MSVIIQLMQAMGYEDVDTGGVCFGLAQGLIQAHLYDEKDWNEIHKMLASLQPDQIKKLVGDKKAIDAEGPLYLDTGAIKQAEERKRLRLLYDKLCEEDDMDKKKALLMFLNDSSEVSVDFRSGEEINQEKIEAIKQNLNTEIEEWKSVPLSKEYGLPEEFTDERLSEVRAFLETVYMYHQGYIKEKDFSGPNSVNQHSQVDLYIDKLLEEEKLIASRVYCHNKDVFTKLLRSMEDIAAPVGFEIRLTGHTMGLVYNANGNWTLVDHDILGEGSTEEIAGHLFERFNMSVDSCGDGDDKSIIYGLIAYAKPEYGASDSNKSQLEGCQQIMDGLKGFNVSQIPEGLDGGYLLLIAAMTGDIKTTQECINTNFDISAQDNKGRTALMWAASCGNTATVEALLAQPKVNINHTDQFGRTALMEAAKKGHVEIVEALLAQSKVNINVTDQFGKTALVIAAKKGHVEIVKALLAHRDAAGDLDVAVNTKDENRMTALMYAAEKGHVEIVKALLDHCDAVVNLDVADNDGMAALMYAAEKGHVETVKALLDHCDAVVNLDVADEDGITALMMAANEGKTEVVKAILAHLDKDENPLIDINVRDNCGNTALLYAAKKGHVEIVKELLAHLDKDGNPLIDINASNERGNTALMIAANEGNTEVVKAILAHLDKDNKPLVEINASNERGKTALMYACKGGKVELAKLLILEKANLDEKDGSGKTALMCACERGKVELAKLLIGNRADIYIQDERKRTAYDYLKQNIKSNEISELSELFDSEMEYAKTECKVRLDKLEKRSEISSELKERIKNTKDKFKVYKAFSEVGEMVSITSNLQKEVHKEAKESAEEAEEAEKSEEAEKAEKEILKGLSESKDWSEEFKKEIDTAQDKSKGAKSLSEIGSIVTITSDLQEKAQREVKILKNSIELELIGEKYEQRYGRLDGLHEVVLEKKGEIEDQRESVMKQGDEVSPQGGNNHTEKYGQNMKKDETGAGTVSKKSK